MKLILQTPKHIHKKQQYIKYLEDTIQYQSQKIYKKYIYELMRDDQKYKIFQEYIKNDDDYIDHLKIVLERKLNCYVIPPFIY